MKRVILILIPLLMVACLCSCTTDKQDSEAITVTPNTTTQAESSPAQEEVAQMNIFYIKANGTTFTAELADNSSARVFYELLAEGDLTLDLSDYGNFEKVGPLGHTLTRNDTQITTQPGDIILYQLTIYYDTNSWSFTRLGKINNVTKSELLEVFGSGDVTVTISLNK